MPRHILIVEDHAELRASLARLVARACTDVTIAQAADGAEALDAVAQSVPDLIISDFQMPLVNGLQLVRTLRAQGRAMPILILSSDPSVAEDILIAGASAFLIKPFRFAILTELLHTFLPDQAEANSGER